jgi:hypothetical protein
MTLCDRTGLTKPECHCPVCIAALVAAHAPARAVTASGAGLLHPAQRQSQDGAGAISRSS